MSRGRKPPVIVELHAPPACDSDHRYLKPGETIEEGDEWFDCNEGIWQPTTMIGAQVVTYRRSRNTGGTDGQSSPY